MEILVSFHFHIFTKLNSNITDKTNNTAFSSIDQMTTTVVDIKQLINKHQFESQSRKQNLKTTFLQQRFRQNIFYPQFSFQQRGIQVSTKGAESDAGKASEGIGKFAPKKVEPRLCACTPKWVQIYAVKCHKYADPESRFVPRDVIRTGKTVARPKSRQIYIRYTLYADE